MVTTGQDIVSSFRHEHKQTVCGGYVMLHIPDIAGCTENESYHAAQEKSRKFIA
jgi:hypothetical protein